MNVTSFQFSCKCVIHVVWIYSKIISTWKQEPFHMTTLASLNVIQIVNKFETRYMITVQIWISARGANLVFGPGGGMLIFFFQNYFLFPGHCHKVWRTDYTIIERTLPTHGLSVLTLKIRRPVSVWCGK